MKKLRNFLLFAFALIFAVQANAAEVFLKEDFDGSLTLGVIDKGTVEYVDGVNGKAVALADAIISFPGSEQLNYSEGSATLWVKPLNYEWTKPEFVFFLTSGAAMRLYKYHLPLGLLFDCGNPGKTTVDNTYANIDWSKFPNHEWMALGVVWSAKQHLIALYINGELAASAQFKDAMVPRATPEVWKLNDSPFAPNDRKNTTAYDCLRFYDCALTADDIALIYNMERPSVNVSVPLNDIRKVTVDIPQLDSAPAINGTFDDREWAGAAKFPGMLSSDSRNIDTPWHGEVYMAHDTEKIFLCTVMKLPGATEITAVQTARDSEVYSDDATELLLRTDKQQDAEYYHGIFNSLNTIFDRCNGDEKWNGSWEVASNMYEGFLITEVAIPFAELDADYHNGMEWGFNVVRDRIVDREIIFSSLGCFKDAGLTTDLSQLRFVDHAIFGRLSLDYNKLETHVLAASMNVSNHSDSTQKVFCKYELLSSPDLKPLDEQILEADLAPNSSQELAYENPLEGRNAAMLRVTAYTAGQEDKPFYLMDLPLAFKEEIRIIDDTDLVNETLKLTVDYSTNAKTKNTAEIQALFNEQPFTLSGSPVAKGEISLRDIPAGTYVIKLVFLDGNGQETYKHNFIYNHIGQPKWLKEHYGENVGVVWPFTPIQSSDTEIKVWGRNHILGNQLLPTQIITQEQNLFAEPPQLLLNINGKETAVDNFRFVPVQQSEAEVLYDFTAEAQGLKIAGNLKVEYDGLFWYDWKMTSAADGKPVTVDGLRLRLKFAPGIAESYNAHFFAREKMAGKLVTPLTLKRIPCVWVGNLDVGLTFMLENFKSWRHADRSSVYELTSEGDNKVCWNIKLIDKQTAIDKEFHYSFGIEANPAKPATPWKRSWKLSPLRPYNIMHPWSFDREHTKKYSGWGGFFTPVFKSREIFLQLLENERKVGAKFALYLNPFLVSNEATEFKIFQKDWNNPYNCYPECPNSTFTDYIMDCVQTLVDDGLEAVYVDSLGAVNCFNPKHGCGYVDEETGENQLTWPVLGMRNYMKRLYSIVHAPGTDPRERFVWAHTSARNCVAFNVFLDAAIGGEEVEHIVVKEPHYAKIYPLDEYQVYYSNTLAGAAMVESNFGRIGPEADRYNKDYNDEFLMLLLLHDTLNWCCWIDEFYVSDLYAKLRDWGYENEELTFHDYHRQKLVTCADDNVHIAVYRQPDGRVMAAICNFNQDSRTIAVKIDWQALGLKKRNCKFRELRSGEAVDAEKLQVRGLNFILLAIEP